MSRNNSSVLWDYFEKTDPVEKKAKCSICFNTFSFKTTTGNLKSHLRQRHIEAYRRVAGEQQAVARVRTVGVTSIAETAIPPANATETANINAETYTPAASSSTKQTKLDCYIPKKISNEQKKKIDDDLMDLFIDGFQPFRLVEDRSFIKFCRWIPGYTLPSRKTVSSFKIPEMYRIVKEEVRSAMAGQVNKICLTTDMWTSKANQSYIAITGHYITKDMYMKSVLLACDYFTDRHTSENIKTFLLNSMEEWGLLEKVNFIVSDNAANVLRAIEDIGWKHYGCYGHSLNLIIQKSLDSVGPTLDKVKTIVQFFKKSTVATEKLLKYQKNENESCIPKKLIQEVSTRWNSMFHMIARFVELESTIRATMAVISKVLPVITNEEWVLLGELSKVLRPFDEVTSSMSGEKYVTGSSLIVLTRCMIRTCDKLLAEDFSGPAKNVATALKTGLETRFDGLEFSGTFSKCTFLDPRYKTAGFESQHEAMATKRKIQEKVANMINKETRSVPTVATPATTEHVPFSAWGTLSELMGTHLPERRGTPLSKAIQEVDMYLEDDMLPVHSVNGAWNCPMEWWRARQQKYPHLAALFTEFGNIVATSVPCERMFSKAGLLISDRRTRLDHKKVAQIMFLNVNMNPSRFK